MGRFIAIMRGDCRIISFFMVRGFFAPRGRRGFDGWFANFRFVLAFFRKFWGRRARLHFGYIGGGVTMVNFSRMRQGLSGRIDRGEAACYNALREASAC